MGNYNKLGKNIDQVMMKEELQYMKEMESVSDQLPVQVQGSAPVIVLFFFYLNVIFLQDFFFEFGKIYT